MYVLLPHGASESVQTCVPVHMSCCIIKVCVCVCVRVLPEAACSIAQHLGGMKVELAVVMVIGGGVPVGVGYDDAIGQNSQRVLDDWHLQGVT